MNSTSTLTSQKHVEAPIILFDRHPSTSHHSMAAWPNLPAMPVTLWGREAWKIWFKAGWLHHPSKFVLWIKEIPKPNKFGQLTRTRTKTEPDQPFCHQITLHLTWAQLVVDCICRWSAISSLIQKSYRLSEMYFGNALKKNCLTTHTFRSVLSPRPSVTSLISDSFLLLTDRKGWFHHVQPLLHSSFPNFHRGHHQNTTLLCRDKSL